MDILIDSEWRHSAQAWPPLHSNWRLEITILMIGGCSKVQSTSNYTFITYPVRNKKGCLVKSFLVYTGQKKIIIKKKTALQCLLIHQMASPVCWDRTRTQWTAATRWPLQQCNIYKFTMFVMFYNCNNKSLPYIPPIPRAKICLNLFGASQKSFQLKNSPTQGFLCNTTNICYEFTFLSLVFFKHVIAQQHPA